MKIVRRILAILLVLVLIGLGVALYALNKIGALRDAPQVSHTAIPELTDGLRIVARPEVAQNFLSEEVPRRLPWASGSWGRWAVEKGLPREIAVQANVDRAQNALAMHFFLNPKRFAPVIVKTINARVAQGGAGAVMWDVSGLSAPVKGGYLLNGAFPLDAQSVREAAALWLGTPGTPLDMEGGRFLEMTLDNRNGQLYALVGTLQALAGARDMNMLAQLKWIKQIHGAGDLLPDSALHVELKIECTGEFSRDPDPKAAAEKAARGFKVMLTNLWLPQMKTWLLDAYGLTITGEFRAEGIYTVGEFKLENARILLERLAPPLSAGRR